MLIKENINFWEENIDSDAEEPLDFINDLFDERADEIMEAILDDDARKVAMSGYVGKMLIIRSSCDSCKQTLASEVVDLENDSYASSTQLADFVCDCFAIPHFSCNIRDNWSFKFASKIVVNIFFNNKQNK